MAPAIPDRWLNYKPLGDRIAGTRFIAFKVPLRQNIVKTVEIQNRLDDDILLRMIPNLGLIIDLTYTDRFYDPDVFLRAGVNYKKLRVPGHVTPSKSLVHDFKLCVTEFLNNNKSNDKLIGVHCTHGVNRTGYFICSYMISELKITPQEAISRFQTARGHRIERDNYINTLQSLPQYYKSSAVKPAMEFRDQGTAFRSTKHRNLREYEDSHPHERYDRNWRDGSKIYPDAAKERLRTPEHRNLREYKVYQPYKRRDKSQNAPNVAKERVRSSEHRNLREYEDRHPHRRYDINWRDGSRIYPYAAKERVRTPEHRNLREYEEHPSYKRYDRRDESQNDPNAAKERVRSPEHQNLGECKEHQPYKKLDRNERDAGYPVRDANHWPIVYEKVNH